MTRLEASQKRENGEIGVVHISSVEKLGRRCLANVDSTWIVDTSTTRAHDSTCENCAKAWIKDLHSVEKGSRDSPKHFSLRVGKILHDADFSCSAFFGIFFDPSSSIYFGSSDLRKKSQKTEHRFCHKRIFPLRSTSVNCLGRIFQRRDVRGKKVESEWLLQLVNSCTEWGCCLALCLVTRPGTRHMGHDLIQKGSFAGFRYFRWQFEQSNNSYAKPVPKVFQRTFRRRSRKEIIWKKVHCSILPLTQKRRSAAPKLRQNTFRIHLEVQLRLMKFYGNR